MRRAAPAPARHPGTTARAAFASAMKIGIPRRVRLMFGRIEVVDTEGEVQGIDVFESRGQKEKMRDQKQDREAGRPEQLRGDSQTCRRIKPSFRLPVR